MLLLVACTLCLVPATLAGEEDGALLPGLSGDANVLLQDAILVRTQPDPPDEIEEWLVDNSNLQHKGPGVRWRLSKDLSNLASKAEYAAWGSTVQGVDEGGGWVKVGGRYLPSTVHGAVVLVKKARPRRISYKPTRVLAPDGAWLECSITGPGSRPGTFNVVVRPPTIEDYKIADVPAGALERLEEDREQPSPVPSKSVVAAAAIAKEPDEAFLHVKVSNFEGGLMDLKFLKKSPLRILMRMSCERLKVEWHKCQQLVRFEHKGKEVGGDNRWDIMGLREGDTIAMSWKPTPTPPRK